MQYSQPNATLQGGKYRIQRVLGQGGFGNRLDWKDWLLIFKSIKDLFLRFKGHHASKAEDCSRNRHSYV